jgi:hypothetical protein
MAVVLKQEDRLRSCLLLSPQTNLIRLTLQTYTCRDAVLSHPYRNYQLLGHVFCTKINRSSLQVPH